MSRPARLDRLCAEAVELARAAAEETGEGVGEYLHAEPEADRVVTHFFESTLAGYRGWRWAVVVARAPRSRTVTVNETALLPGPDALSAPEWLPWAERLRAGDVGVGDLLPTDESDTRLNPAYTYSDDDAVEDIAYELGVGRTRVMSREGRIDTAERWYEGEHGPNAEISTSAPAEARCGGCGFYLPLAGSLRQLFGVCGNMYASDDASVVSSDHGCGAHSEVLTQIDPNGAGLVDLTDTAYDDALIEQIDTDDEDEDETDASAAVDTETDDETDDEDEDEDETDASAAVDTETDDEDAESPVAETETPEAVVAETRARETEVAETETSETAVAETQAPETEVAETEAVTVEVAEPETTEPETTEAATVEVDVADTAPTEPDQAEAGADESEPVPAVAEVAAEPVDAPADITVTVPQDEPVEVAVIEEPEAPAVSVTVTEPAEAVSTEADDTPEPIADPKPAEADTPVVETAATPPATEDESVPGPESSQVSSAADASDSDHEAP